MYGLENENCCGSAMALPFLGVTAPKHVYDALLRSGDRAYHGVGEGFPAAAACGTASWLRRRSAFSGHTCSAQRSRLPVAEGRPGVVGDSAEDHSAARAGTARRRYEAEIHWLVRAVVERSLTDDHSACRTGICRRRGRCCAARIDAPRGVFYTNCVRSRNGFRIQGDSSFPVGGDLYIHVARWLKWCKM